MFVKHPRGADHVVCVLFFITLHCPAQRLHALGTDRLVTGAEHLCRA